MLKFRTMKTVLLTGSSSELGKAIVNTLSEANFEVVPLKLDIADDASCNQAIKKIGDRKIFALINVAGVNKYGESLSFSPQEFMDLLNVNAVGQFRLLKTLNDQKMLPSRVINITSLNSILAWPKFALYCATKFAADGLGLALRYELSPRVQITNIAPGAIYRPGAIAYHQRLRDKNIIAKLLFPYVTDETIASKIANILKTKTMPARIMIGSDAIIVYWMQKLLPLWLFDKIVLWLT